VCFLGYPDQALAHVSAAVEAFERLGAMGSVVHNCVQRLRLFATWRDQSGLDERAAEALRLCRAYAMPHQTAVAKIFEGYAIARRGDLRAGGASIRAGLADHVGTGAVVNSAYYRALLAEMRARQGDARRIRLRTQFRHRVMSSHARCAARRSAARGIESAVESIVSEPLIFPLRQLS
jgi:hypothetical protein